MIRNPYRANPGTVTWLDPQGREVTTIPVAAAVGMARCHRAKGHPLAEHLEAAVRQAEALSATRVRAA